MTWLPSLAAELAITVSNGEVWLSIGQALLCGGACLLFGTWVARAVGLLRSDAPAGETLGVGLASGLLVVAAWWAAIWSGGRSSFTPVAVGFAIALALAAGRRARHADAPASGAVVVDEATPTSWRRGRSLLLTGLAGAVFVVAVAMLYGATMAPSPRDGVQPVEFRDAAFYAILGRDLATTGTETNSSPSGFTDLPGVPAQTWYHWGELWLASAVITVFGTAPLPARYLIVLPVLLLAAAALTGTLVRRMTGPSSRGVYLFGFLACLFLTPVPLLAKLFVFPLPIGSLVVSLLYGIDLYGLAAVAVLLALYCVTVLGTQLPAWALAGFVGSAAALILPAHIVIAVLALVGVGSVATVRIGQSLLATRRLPAVSPIWRRTLIATGIALASTVVWGQLTGHGLGGGGSSSSVTPFNASWRDSVVLVALVAGVFWAIPLAWFVARRRAPVQADLYLGTMALLVVGAIAWGARLADFNMFYFFFAGVAVFATPAAAVAVRTLLLHLREAGHIRLAAVLVLLCVAQLELGAYIGIQRVQLNGPGAYAPVPLSLLADIKGLPPEAKLAYACNPFEEVTFGTPNLLSLDAHTGRRVVPMCFEADVFSTLIGAQPNAQVPAADFALAPQRALYPDAAAHPSSTAVAAFLKDHGIDYIYADAIHPNSLGPDAILVARSGDHEVLRVP